MHEGTVCQISLSNEELSATMLYHTFLSQNSWCSYRNPFCFTPVAYTDGASRLRSDAKER